jgi:excisionase family DNA binding protein
MVLCPKSDPLRPLRFGGAMVTELHTTQITMSVDETTRALSIRKAFLYELLACGAIRSVKLGKRRLILVASIYQYLAELQRIDLEFQKGH